MRWVWLHAGGAVALSAGILAQGPPRLPAIDIVNDARARSDLALTFDLPRGLPGDALQLRSEDGAVIALQVTTDRQASFVLPRLEAGERRRLTIEPALDRVRRPVVDAARRQTRVEITVDQRPLLVYQGEPPTPSADLEPRRRRGGYLHPVLTPLGRTVTDDDAPTAPDQHGIWAAWSKTTLQGRHPDFWNAATGSGRVEFESIADTWSGLVHGGLRARHRYVDLSTTPPTTVINEVFAVTAYGVGRSAPGYRVFDLVLEQDPAAPHGLELAERTLGPLGVRGPPGWRGRGAQVLTSEGRTRANGDGTRARWCSVGGLVEGRPAAIAILDHPQNVRHPQTLRLHPSEPFFGYAPLQNGGLTVAPGTSLVSRYRFVVWDGPADAALLERLWHDFAHPPGITAVK